MSYVNGKRIDDDFAEAMKDKQETKHTPTPWKLAQSVEGYKSIIETSEGLIGRIVTRDSLRDEANAELIVRAVNSHEALLEIVAWVVNGPKDMDTNHAIYAKAKKAIAQAEEVKP